MTFFFKIYEGNSCPPTTDSGVNPHVGKKLKIISNVIRSLGQITAHLQTEDLAKIEPVLILANCIALPWAMTTTFATLPEITEPVKDVETGMFLIKRKE